ncbi:MAG: DNA repair protein RecO [Desulfovibrio sp.]|nr:DNA repair protein RecO [Desulfovibrio sp.]
MEWSDRGVILRHGLFHEADMWVRILFRERGLATAFAFGAAKSKVRFCGCLDTFNTIDVRLKTSSRNNYINMLEASLIESPANLRTNWRSMGLGFNCLRFMEAADIDADAAPECFSLAENLRRWLEREKTPDPMAARFFRISLARLLGYAPNLNRCARCGCHPNGEAFFHAEEGRLYCGGCNPGDRRGSVALSPVALANLRALSSVEPADWTGFSLTGPDRRACSRLIDNFIEYHLGLKWDNGFFRRS